MFLFNRKRRKAIESTDIKQNDDIEIEEDDIEKCFNNVNLLEDIDSLEDIDEEYINKNIKKFQGTKLYSNPYYKDIEKFFKTELKGVGIESILSLQEKISNTTETALNNKIRSLSIEDLFKLLRTSSYHINDAIKDVAQGEILYRLGQKQQYNHMAALGGIFYNFYSESNNNNGVTDTIYSGQNIYKYSSLANLYAYNIARTANPNKGHTEYQYAIDIITLMPSLKRYYLHRYKSLEKKLESMTSNFNDIEWHFIYSLGRILNLGFNWNENLSNEEAIAVIESTMNACKEKNGYKVKVRTIYDEGRF